MAERKLFILTLKEIGGGLREVSLLLDEAVSDDPDFLVAAISEMKATLSGEISTERQVAQAINPAARRERFDQHVREELVTPQRSGHDYRARFCRERPDNTEWTTGIRCPACEKAV